jgi:hypothetical protein
MQGVLRHRRCAAHKAKTPKAPWARLSKNPKSWVRPYSLLVVGKGSTLIYKQFKTKEDAEKGRVILIKKAKTLSGARHEMGWE